MHTGDGKSRIGSEFMEFLSTLFRIVLRREEAGTSWVSNLINLAAIQRENVAFNPRYQWWRKSKIRFTFWLLWSTQHTTQQPADGCQNRILLIITFQSPRTRPFYFVRKDFLYVISKIFCFRSLKVVIKFSINFNFLFGKIK